MVVVVALILFNFRWHKPTAVVLLALSGVLVLAPSQATVEWMDVQWGNVEWNQRQNYLTRGATLYTLQESYRYFTDRATVDDPVAVARAMEALQGSFSDVGSPTPFKPRNVHLILLETFWDPTVLTAARLSEDPFDPELRVLWRETGYSRALSPVFGGYTANAEFEVLCGFPVDENSVKFERRLRNKVPCLPQVLAQEGYKTVASHPNIPAFWNRTNAYRRVGFETFWSIEDFKMDDMMNDEFLSDASYLTQLTEKLASNVPPTTPVFNYVVTIFGHLPFPLNEARPDVIKSASSVPEVGKYAN
ncbi:MAG: phosphoglycerol transferase family protein alkaline phosphatase superfamily, partial [Halothiobacillaceae bacterium]